MQPFELAEPQTLDEALKLLDPADGSIRPVAGATAVLLMMKQQVFQPTRLVSLRHLQGDLAYVQSDGQGGLRIGAMLSLSDLEHSPEVRQVAPVITAACHRLANVRVRNVATIGGNLAHGDPHTDLPPVLLALSARVKAQSPRGERWIDLADFFQGYYATALALDELLTELHIPAPQPGWGGVYLKYTALSAEDWPTVGVAAFCRQNGGKLHDVRLTLSAATEQPVRLAAAEAVLEGQAPTAAALQAAAAAAAGAVEPIPDARGSVTYKRHLISVFVRRAVAQAMTAPAI